MIQICTPAELRPKALQIFYDMVVSGGQVPIKPEVLIKNINNCLYLALYTIEAELVGIAAIKRPQDSYRKKVFDNASLTDEIENFPYEIGYFVTDPKHKGKGIAKGLFLGLMKIMEHKDNIFATTQHPAMKKLFLDYGFTCPTPDATIQLYIYKP